MALAVRPLVAGNWKMNGLQASESELAGILGRSADILRQADILVCPPATLIARFAARAAGSKVAIGAQDCHAQASGAFTGDLSAEMLKDAGATAIIVGHSERRTLHRETDAMVHDKAEAVARASLTAIVCVGETRQEREAGQTLSVVGRQLGGSVPATFPAERLVVAYEPVWAIGTGLTPTMGDVAEVHAFIREQLLKTFDDKAHGVRILYGGSVKPANARDLLTVPNVNGALVGGASLKADEFLAIGAAYL